MGELYPTRQEGTFGRREKVPLTLALESIREQLSFAQPVKVYRDGLNGDLLGDVEKTTEACIKHGGVVVLWGANRSGKTSIMRTITSELKDSGQPYNFWDMRIDVDSLCGYSPINQLVVIDEVDKLDPKVIAQVTDDLLVKGNTLLVANHLGYETNGDIYRESCFKLRLPHSRIRMVSRDRRDKGTRIESWWTCLVDSAYKKKPGLKEIIADVVLTPDAATRLGNITACRPYETSYLTIKILDELIGAGEKAITPEMVQAVWNKQRDKEGAIYEWHKYLLKSLEKGGPDGKVEVAPDTVRRIFRAHDLVGQIVRGELVDRLAVTTLLGNYLDKSGLGFIGLKGDNPYIIGEWLAKDWGRSFGVE